MNRRPARTRKPDEGFTLIEMLLVMVVLGIVMGALAMVVTVVLRTTPPSEVRADDARSLQGLVTWIPQDVDAAPPGGFDTDVNAWPCGGAAPGPDSYSLLAITWTEKTAVTINYAANYRYARLGDEWKITRYTCDDSSGAMSVPFRQALTAELPAWDTATPPASVTMCSAPVDNNGDCPAGSVITTPTSPDVESLKFKVTRIDGVVSTIDAAPKNPDQDLADDPNATTNHYPTVSNTDYVLDMYAGDTTTIDLNTTHNPNDIDGHTLSVAIDSSLPMPAGVTASTADPLDLTVTTDPSLSTGTLSPSITLIISDPFAGWISVTVTVNIVPEPNLPPTVSPATFHVDLAPGDDIVLPLDVSHGASDPNGDPLGVTVVTHPNVSVHPPQDNHPRPLDLEIRARGSAPLGPAVAPIQLLIDDGNGGTVPATITVTIVAATANTPPTATTTNVGISMYAGDTTTLFLDASHGVSDPEGQPLKISQLLTAPVGITTDFKGGLELDIIADPSLSTGTLSPVVEVEVEDIYSEALGVTITVTIIPTPPPPSDCVLGTLSASPSTVDRQGNGSGPRHLKEDVTVTLTYTGSCDGLVLKYDTGDTSGLGVGTGRVFPPGSPTSIVIYGKGNGGTEKWLPGTHTLTAETTSAVTPNQVTTTLTVT